MKMLTKVWKEVVKLQRNFLWGGVSPKRRISWVKWADMCKPKIEGGLGIRDLRLVNLSLLAKWRWKLLTNGDEVWKNVIVAKYGVLSLGNVRVDATVRGSLSSTWWKDLCRLDNGVGWLNQVTRKKVESGNSTKFWEDIWVGNQALEHRYPRLFSMSVQKGDVISDLGNWVNGEWLWNLRWHRNFFIWEEPLAIELGEVINNVVITEAEDRWVWTPNVDEGFSVKSLYMYLHSTLIPLNPISNSARFAFKNIWRSVVPSKVSALAWQILLDRIPSRENLCKRGVLHYDETRCPLCNTEMETTRHLFLHCPFVSAVWYALNRWLGVMVVPSRDVLMSYGQLVCSGRNRRIRKGFSSVWLAFVWVIWKVRNDRVFNNVNGDVDGAVGCIQRLSWQWFLNRVAANSCLLYEWIWDPGDCMNR
jgi:hypothetical protein